MSDTNNCLHCGSNDLEIVEKHPGTVRADAEGTALKIHHIYKCNNCGNKSSDCDKLLRILVYSSIENIDMKVIDKVQCVYIEQNYVFILARILYFIREGEYKNAIQSTNDLELQIKNSQPQKKDLILNTQLIKAFLFYKLGDDKKLHKAFNLLPSDSAAYETGSLFVYQLLNLLRDDNRESYNSFKEYWFDDFQAPFDIIEMPDVYDEELTFIENNIEKLFRIQGFFDLITLSLLDSVIRKYTKWDKIQNDDIVLFNQIIKNIYVSEAKYRKEYDDKKEERGKKILEGFLKKKISNIDDEDNEDFNDVKPYNSYADIVWFKNLKALKDQLSFDLFIYNEKYDDAFSYYEIEGVNHIIYKDGIGYDYGHNEEDFFILTPHIFPVNFEADIWLPAEDMHEITYLSYYSEVWGRVLKYLTVVHFYEAEINKHDIQTQKFIKDRILFVTNEFLKDSFLERELFRRRIPNIVPQIYEERNQWEKALEMWKMANASEDEKRNVLERYQIDGKLFNSIQDLKTDEQRQIIVYIKLIIQLEPQLRKFIRRLFKPQDIQIDEMVGKYFPEVDNRIKREGGKQLTYDPDIRQDKLDWLTLPELFTLITHRDFNLYRILGINKEQILTAKTVLSPIRNYIAHAVPVTETDIDITVKYVDKILDSINKIKVK